MRSLCLPFALLLGLVSMSAQDLVMHQDFVSEVTWPFLWDIEQDPEGRLYVCSEQGLLFVKSEGTWTEYDVDPSSTEEARGIAIDENGMVWVGTHAGLFSFQDGVFTSFTSANSGLPSDKIRAVKAYKDELWIVTDGNGIILKKGDSYTYYTEANSDLESDFVSDLEITADGTVVLGRNRYVHFIKDGVWTTYDFDNLYGFQTWTNDIFIDQDQSIWFATDNGLIRYNHDSEELESLQDKYGKRKYSAIILTPENELWLGEIFKGLHYFNEAENAQYYFDGEASGAPEQVFDFIYYQDTVRFVGNRGASPTGLTINNALINSTREIDPTGIMIYPNPVADVLKIDIRQIEEQNLQFSVHNNSGQRVYHTGITQQIDMTAWPGGFYTLEVRDTRLNRRLVKKIIISR